MICFSLTSSNDILEEDLTGFLDVWKKSLDYQTPRKNNILGQLNPLFLMKEINKEIMTRSRLRNKFLCCRSDQNKKTHNEQCNRCVKPVRNAKKQARSQGGEGGRGLHPCPT